MSCVPCSECGRGCGSVPTPIGLLCNDCAADHSAGNGER